MDIQVIEVRLWGTRVGAVAPDPRLGCCVFAYEPAWRRSGIELSPLVMPLNTFPRIPLASPTGSRANL